MAVAIRLARGGSKKRPYYRIVVADSRNARDGRFIEKIGTYNPLLAKDSPERVKLDVDSLYLRDGRFHSSGGLTAGMDLALALVTADFGADVALTVARELVMYMHRPGNQAQFSAPLDAQTRGTRGLASLLEAGLTVEQAFNALIEQAEDERSRQVLAALRGEVLAGNTVAKALASFPNVFPELYRTLAISGAKVLVVPAAFMLYTGRDHWEVLLRARAIENQCYVVAAGQIGDHEPGRSCNGRSMVVDPWGTVVAQAPDTVTVAFADLDLTRVDRIRMELPSLANRRLR